MFKRIVSLASTIGLLLVVLAPVANAARPSTFADAVASCDTSAVWYISDGKGQGKPDVDGNVKRQFCKALDRFESGEDHRTGNAARR